MENRRIIKVDVPKEIWDAHMSIFNYRKDILGAWMSSIRKVINKQINKKKQNYGKIRKKH
tara:strand:- start:1272 stop:1451 length:180 start_codon:yes stop_codon:yes gene_type:complete